MSYVLDIIEAVGSDPWEKHSQAYRAGREAYVGNQPISSNPHGKPPKKQVPSSQMTPHDPPVHELASEWDRAYKAARKHDRFNATIAARGKQ